MVEIAPNLPTPMLHPIDFALDSLMMIAYCYPLEKQPPKESIETSGLETGGRTCN